ncbi:DUF4405 domain-containing protein [Undibacterium arcticum]|uniref:DUF4405 domain-containing protein n=1 Tax=Undibacterium arcticum TaxID=1762892 RepID=A0ABV7F0J1_9BURK
MPANTIQMRSPHPPKHPAKPRPHSLHHPSAPRPVSLKLERWQRRALYGAFALLTLSGLLWLLAHYWWRPVGEYGETISPLEPWAMKLHGAAAMLALFLVGGILNNHIRRALKSRRNRSSGWAMVALLALLTLSGYALYYIAGEQSRPLWSVLHWIIGLGLPLLVLLHIVLGRRSAR